MMRRMRRANKWRAFSSFQSKLIDLSPMQCSCGPPRKPCRVCVYCDLVVDSHLVMIKQTANSLLEHFSSECEYGVFDRVLVVFHCF